MRRYEDEIGYDPDGGTDTDHRPEGEAWIREMEAAGRTAVFFLLLPVLLVALLLAGCGDSGQGRAVDGGDAESSAMSTSTRPDPASRTGSTTRPSPPTSSDSGRLDKTGEPDDGGEKAFTGPVSFASAEEAYLQGRFDEAHRMFSAYTTEYPDNPWGFYMTGLAAWKKGELDGAERALEETVRMDSSHVKGWVNLARVRLDAGRPGDAGEAVSRALELDGGERSDVFRVRGRVAQEEGRLEEAAEAYRSALVLDPEDAWSMNNLALIHIHRGDFERALPPLARAVQLRDDVPVFQNNLGTALEKTGRFATAAEAYRKADELGDGYEKAKTSLARVESVKEPSGMKDMDLSEFAQSFIEQVETWRLERTAVADTDDPTEAPSPDVSDDTGSANSTETVDEGRDPGPK